MGAGHMIGSIDRSKYDVVPVGITRAGDWVQVADEPTRLAISDGELPSVEAAVTPASGIARPAGTEQAPAEIVASAPSHIPHLLGDVDVVLPLLHGPFGEDGTVQGLLEIAGVPYVGAGVLASAVSMDKEYMKLIFAARGLPLGPYVVLGERDWSADGEDPVPAAVADLGWPLFVKPARGGSSIGASKAHDLAQLRQSVALARQYDPKILIEAAITGHEVEVAVLQGRDGAPPDTSLPGQLLIEGGEEFWDFEAKYLDTSSGMAIPAPIPPAATAEIRRLAAAAFDAVSCEGLARVDFFYTTTGEILINEINTIPGMAPASYFQKMWEATGLSLPQLIDRLLETALARRPGLH
jgi:D-alanine-D-alanine ligase